MKQYLDAVRTVLSQGTRKPNRTGVDTLSTFGVHYNIDLRQGFPLLTTKQISWKNIVVELLWFLSGQTHIGVLKEHGCKFWDAWADPATGEVPSAYGNFWRHFPVHCLLNIRQDGVETVGSLPDFNDQLAWLVATLKKDPMSRRMVVSAWAPGNAQTSKLPPCHCLFVVNVQNEEPRSVHYGHDDGSVPACGASRSEAMLRHGEGMREGLVWCARCKDRIPQLENPEWKVRQRLCLHLTQRSCDIALGVPYNIASYALLAHLLGQFSGIAVGEFGHTLIDAHSYTARADGSMAEYDHVPGLREQLTRTPRPLPRLRIDPSITALDDVPRLLKLSTDELMRLFVLEGYDPYPAIPFKVAV